MSVGSSSSLLAALRAAADSPTAVDSLLNQFAPQLLQTEQQIETCVNTIDPDTTQLYEWVRSYTEKFATEVGPSRTPSNGTNRPPAPLFFYFLHHHAMHICMAFLSALYTDPNTDQDFYWLNDVRAFFGQLQTKVALVEEENRQIVHAYAINKTIDVSVLSTHLTLYTGVRDILQSLLATRSRALVNHVAEVQTFLNVVSRQRTRVEWQVWLASRSSGLVLREIDQALAASDAQSWHQAYTSRRSYKANAHAKAFRSFLHGVQSSDAQLASLLVDDEYTEEPELYVDRLWSLACNSFQHSHHADAGVVDGSSSSLGAVNGELSWSYPPPSAQSMLDIFLLPEIESSNTPTNLSAPPPSYKVWFMYYFLIDFQARRGVEAIIAEEFADQAGLNPKQRTLIHGMVHMDAAYQLAAGETHSSDFTATREQAFVSALACFSSDYDSLLSQPDFPLVSSILASVVVLRQWAHGVTFFQNCFIANAAAAASTAAYALGRAQWMKLNGGRKADHQPAQPTPPQEQVHVVFYSTLHHVFYVYILLRKSLFYESVQFIRSLADVDVVSSSATSTVGTVNTTLQLILWNYWNQLMYQQRHYQVLLKQVSISKVEQEIMIRYWKNLLRLRESPSQTNTTTIGVSSPPSPTLSPADLIILYHFEKHEFDRGLRFYRRFKTSQSKLPTSSRTHLKLPQEMIAGYAKLVKDSSYSKSIVHDDTFLVDGDDDDGLDELDMSSIQLTHLTCQLSRQHLKHAQLLQQIIANHQVGMEEEGQETTVHMIDVQRVGSDMNPFSAANESVRQAQQAAAAAAASAAALARSQSKVASPAKSVVAHVDVAAPIVTSPPMAPAVAPKSPEKTPRIQKVSASLSAAKAKRTAQMEERQAKQAAEAQAEEEAKAQEEAEANKDEEEEEESAIGHITSVPIVMEEDDEPAKSFPSFASPSPATTRASLRRSASREPVAAVVAAAVPTPTRHRKTLISSTKPIAFSDMGLSTITSASDFLLPLPEDVELAPNNEPAAKTRSKRSTRGSSKATDVNETIVPTPTRSRSRSTSSAVSTFTPLPAANLPDSSSFAASYLAPVAPASLRLKSSRKRPLSSVPTNLPLGPSASQLVTAAAATAATPTRATRHAIPASERITRSIRATGSNEPSDEEASPVTSRQPSRSRSPARSTVKSTRRGLTSASVADDDMSDVASQPPARSTRRSAAVPSTPASAVQDGGNVFQRGTARRTRTGPIFIDESLLLAAGGDGDADDTHSIGMSDDVDLPKRTRSNRSTRPTRVDESVSPARSTATASATNSPNRPTRATGRKTPTEQGTATTTTTRTTRRTTRQGTNEEAPQPTIVTRTRSKAK